MRGSLRERARDGLLRAAATLHVDGGARALAAMARGGVRVMNLHGTPARHADALDAQLRWVRAHFDVLDPAAYLAIADGRAAPPPRPAIVLTFDDGLASNARIAAPALERLGMRGVFFVNPSFAQSHGADARRFFTTRIRASSDPTAFTDEDVEPMTCDEIRALRARGHVIGNHTASHANLRQVPASELDAEIRGARDTLSTWLGEPVECFAWTFAWDAITAPAWALAAATHRYCFTPCPGTNVGAAPTRIWRTNTEADLPAHAYRFFYSGLADPIWWRRRHQLARIHSSLVRS